MTASNLKLVVFVGKIASEGRPKTISTCLEMITVISFFFMFPKGKRKTCKVLEMKYFNN